MVSISGGNSATSCGMTASILSRSGSSSSQLFGKPVYSIQ